MWVPCVKMPDIGEGNAEVEPWWSGSVQSATRSSTSGPCQVMTIASR